MLVFTTMINKSIILISGIILQCVLIFAQPAGNKKALLIGVGKYPVAGGWPSLNSANDLKLIKDALQNQGFASENISTVADDQATKQNIITAIQSKTKEVKKGDIVFFHFSGHGQQMEDKDGDEIDGYDECIVPYDSPKKYQSGVYEGQNLLSDDELNLLFRDLRKKLGSSGHLIVSLDACHSGTGTRGAATGRGTTEPMASPEYVQKNTRNKLLKENNQINNNQDDLSSASSLAPMIAFFGSAQNQINYEMTDDKGEQFGSLSYALAKYLVLLKKDESYRGLFDKIKVEMGKIAPLQQPQAEGDLDIEVLNGKALGSASYYKVVSTTDEDKIIINGGFLHGINEGAVMGFFKSDTRDIENTKPIATGKVSKSLSTSSYITLDSVMDPEILKESWVFVLEKSMGNLKIALKIELSDNALVEKLKAKFFSYKFIVEDPKNPNLIIDERNDKNGDRVISLSTDQNYVIETYPISNFNSGTLAKLNRSIIKYAQGVSIRKLELENELIKLSLQIIPFQLNRNVSNIDSLVTLPQDVTGTRKIMVGDTFQVLIINDGEKPAYFNLIDLQPDNMFTILLPAKDQTAEEMKILPGQKKLLPNQFIVGEPLGNELFKLIASGKPLDLKSTYGTRGNSSRNPFEKLMSEFENVEFYNTRGSKPLPLGNMDINIFSESFIIAK